VQFITLPPSFNNKNNKVELVTGDTKDLKPMLENLTLTLWFDFNLTGTLEIIIFLGKKGGVKPGVLKIFCFGKGSLEPRVNQRLNNS